MENFDNDLKIFKKVDEFDDNSYIVYSEKYYRKFNVNGYGEIKYLLDDKELDAYNTMFQKAFPVETNFNPKQDYIPKSYFHESDVYKKLKRAFFKIIKSEENSFKYFVGTKGIGKTLSCNILLKDYGDDLENDDKRIFWLRCDCERLLNLIDVENYTHNRNDNIIQKYFDIQFMYVFTKYFEDGEIQYPNRPFFQDIFDKIKDEKVKYQITKDATNIENRKEGFKEITVVEAIKIYKQQEDLARELRPVMGNYSWGIEEVLANLFQPEKKHLRSLQRWQRISTEIQNILIKKHNYKFLKIIDGVDNYKKYDRYGDASEEFELLVEFLLEYRQNYERLDDKYKGNVIIFMRRNTYIYFMSKCQTTKSIRNRPEMQELLGKNSLTDKKQILDKRKKYCIDPNTTVAEILNTVIESIDSDDGEEFKNYIKADKQTCAFLMNTFRLVPPILYYQQKYNLKGDRLLHFLRTHHPLNLMLNGYFINQLIREKYLNIDNGLCLINIFYYDCYDGLFQKRKKWQGLIGIRILQTLQDSRKFPRSVLFNNIKRLFGYDEKHIKYFLARLMTTALVKYLEDDNYTSNNETDPLVAITSKGEAALKLIFSNLDILYHCALSAPMPVALFENEKSFININDLAIENRNYAISCLKTSYTFIQYIKYINYKEIKGLSKQDYKKFDIEFNYEILNKRTDDLSKSLNTDTLGDYINILNKYLTYETNIPKFTDTTSRKDISYRNNEAKLLNAIKNNTEKLVINFLKKDKYLVENELNKNSFILIYKKCLEIENLLHINNEHEVDSLYHYTSLTSLEELILRNDTKFCLFPTLKSKDVKEGKELLLFLDYTQEQIDEIVASENYRAYTGSFTFMNSDIKMYEYYSKDKSNNVEPDIGGNMKVKKEYFSDYPISCISGDYLSLKSKLSAYRCIYLDSQTGRIKCVSRMNENNFIDKDKQFTEYEQHINTLSSTIEQKLNELKDLIKKSGIDKNTVAKLLVNIRYLIKPAEYCSEHEGRIIRIVNTKSRFIKNSSINADKNCLHIEYLSLRDFVSEITFSRKYTQQNDFITFQDMVRREKLNIKCNYE